MPIYTFSKFNENWCGLVITAGLTLLAGYSTLKIVDKVKEKKQPKAKSEAHKIAYGYYCGPSGWEKLD